MEKDGEELIMVITLLPRFWRQDPSKLPRPMPGMRRPTLRKAALFDLAAIQQCIQSGELDDGAVLVVTTQCSNDLASLRWTYTDLLHFVSLLRPYDLNNPNDFKSAEWCQGSGGEWYPCDAYAAHFDLEQWRRSASGLSIYVKFSVPEDGACLLFTVSAHD